MRISDWSSDVCSSDLHAVIALRLARRVRAPDRCIDTRQRILDFLYRDQDLAVILRQRPVVACACGFDARTAGAAFEQRQADRRPPRPALRGIAAMPDAVDADHEIGIASWKERVCQNV